MSTTPEMAVEPTTPPVKVDYPNDKEWQPNYNRSNSMAELTKKIGLSLRDLVEAAKTTQTTDQLLPADWVVLGMFFFISVSIGVYLGWQAKRTAAKSEKGGDAANEKLTGGRTLTGLPVALSCTASFMSAITILGTPVEIYTFGTMFYYCGLTYFCVAIIIAGFFLPVMYPLNLANGYEYFRNRFDSVVLEKMASTGFLFSNLLYMGIVCYAPALALSAVCNLDNATAAALTAATCTIYTFIGGLKAVIWVDVFQAITIMSGFVSIIAVGASKFGGIGNIIDINESGGRVFFNDFRADPTIRSSLWSVVIGGTFGVWGGIYTNQSMIQRYMACKNIFEAKKSVFLNVIGLWFIMILAGLCGHTAYAYFQFCDPYEQKWFKNETSENRGDQLIPYLSVSELKHLPGLAGLYAAAVYAGTLSSLSGGINSNAAVILKNYIKPIIGADKVTEKMEAMLIKVLILVIGVLTFGVSMLVPLLGKSVLKAGLSSLGMLGGPHLGLFLLGFLCPFADRTSGIIAFTTGHIVALFTFIGQFAIDPPKAYESNPLTKENCLCGLTADDIWNNTAKSFDISDYPCLQDRIVLDVVNQEVPKRSFLELAFHLSYFHLGSIGCFTVFFTGWIAAIIRAKILKVKMAPIGDKWLHPLVRRCQPEEQAEKFETEQMMN